MSTLIASDKMVVILGLGKTGLSVARFLTKQNRTFVVVDTRDNPPGLAELKTINANVTILAGTISEHVETIMCGAEEIIISPGISRDIPVIKAAIKMGISVVGDVELFLREAKAPVVGITGSNGKTTVTTLVGLAAEKAGLHVKVAGNIGIPALDVLHDSVELYVLELSSFQLESIPRAKLSVACNLNVSADHMDRYSSLAVYCMAKQRIFWGAERVVYNLDDKLTQPPAISGVHRFGFGLGVSSEQGDSKYLYDGESAALKNDNDTLLLANELKMFGRHNIANALAVMGICDAARIDRAAVLNVLRTFKGLPHRCEWAGEKKTITFINDSKATNVGATIAAIEGLYADFSAITLIAGGDGKDADFSALGNVIEGRIRVLVLVGVDAGKIAAQVNKKVTTFYAESLPEAVQMAYQKSEPNSAVLLSPACASFDMFSGFEARGECFIASVEALVA